MDLADWMSAVFVAFVVVYSLLKSEYSFLFKITEEQLIYVKWAYNAKVPAKALGLYVWHGFRLTMFVLKT